MKASNIFAVFFFVVLMVTAGCSKVNTPMGSSSAGPFVSSTNTNDSYELCLKRYMASPQDGGAGYPFQVADNVCYCRHAPPGSCFYNYGGLYSQPDYAGTYLDPRVGSSAIGRPAVVQPPPPPLPPKEVPTVSKERYEKEMKASARAIAALQEAQTELRKKLEEAEKSESPGK